MTKQFSGTPYLRICDLGSAGGKNSLNLLHRIIPFLNGREVEYIFEDLPSADINELVATLHKAQLPSNIKARYNCVISSSLTFQPDSQRYKCTDEHKHESASRRQTTELH